VRGRRRHRTTTHSRAACWRQRPEPGSRLPCDRGLPQPPRSGRRMYRRGPRPGSTANISGTFARRRFHLKLVPGYSWCGNHGHYSETSGCSQHSLLEPRASRRRPELPRWARATAAQSTPDRGRAFPGPSGAPHRAQSPSGPPCDRNVVEVQILSSASRSPTTGGDSPTRGLRYSSGDADPNSGRLPPPPLRF